MRGRYKAPTGTKLEQATLNDYELPESPSWLSAEAAEHWKYMSIEMRRMGLTSSIDVGAFSQLCQAWGEYLHMEKVIQTTGYVVQSQQGGWYQRPEVGIRNKAWERYNKLCHQFGITPLARERLSIKPSTAANELEDFINE